MQIGKKISLFLCIVNAVFTGLLFFPAETSAVTSPVNISCGPVGAPVGFGCATNVATTDTAYVSSIVLTANGQDDGGYITITGPNGSTTQHNGSSCLDAVCSSVSFHHGTNPYFTNGDVTSWFTFDGTGVYTIQGVAMNNTSIGSGWDPTSFSATFTITTCVPSCPVGSCTDGCGGYCNGNSCGNNSCSVGPSPTWYHNGVCGGGTCNYTSTPCADTNVCTDDLCDPATGCSNPNDDANFCTDNKNCTSPDKCDAGTCKTSVNCNSPPNNKCFQLPGACDETTWNCKYAAQSDKTPCDSGNNCSPGECFGGNCQAGPNVCGGLVPCGRSADDPKTADIDESKPCQVCHLFVLFDRIIDFLLVYILFPLAVLMLVVAGALYVGAVFEVVPGGFQILNQAKGIIFSVIIAAIVIFAAYILIGLFLRQIGLADWTTSIYKDWWGQGLFKINCKVN